MCNKGVINIPVPQEPSATISATATMNKPRALVTIISTSEQLELVLELEQEL